MGLAPSGGMFYGSIVKNVKKKPQLSKWAIKEIEEARKRMAKGEYITGDELKKRLGL